MYKKVLQIERTKLINTQNNITSWKRRHKASSWGSPLEATEIRQEIIVQFRKIKLIALCLPIRQEMHKTLGLVLRAGGEGGGEECCCYVMGNRQDAIKH